MYSEACVMNVLLISWHRRLYNVNEYSFCKNKYYDRQGWRWLCFQFVCLFVSVCLSVNGINRKVTTNFDDFFGWMRCLTSSRWLDFGDDPEFWITMQTEEF